MDELPDTGGEWMGQVNRRLTRLERRLTLTAFGPVMSGGAFLVRTTAVPETGWVVVDELIPPSGWVYVARVTAGA